MTEINPDRIREALNEHVPPGAETGECSIREICVTALRNRQLARNADVPAGPSICAYEAANYSGQACLGLVELAEGVYTASSSQATDGGCLREQHIAEQTTVLAQLVDANSRPQA